MIQRISKWFGRRLLMLAVRLYPDTYRAQIVQLSTDMAKRIAMDYMKKEGIIHCISCPSKQTLRYVGKFLFCPKCYPIALRGEKELLEASGGERS